MNDLIHEVIEIEGQGLTFLGVVYQENGNPPRALCQADFGDGSIVLGSHNGSEVEVMKRLLRDTSKQIADAYGCEMTIVSRQQDIACPRYVQRFEHMKKLSRSPAVHLPYSIRS